uniref:Zinc finger, FYVE domain containing 19 n=1 Tax=Salmo trutta TaxID=8032 RepID=A0A674EJN6_SALTR
IDNHCYSSKFTLFRKELGSKNYGQSSCSGCLTFNAVLPSFGNTQQKVCKQCHGNLARWSYDVALHESSRTINAKQGLIPTKGLSKEDLTNAERLQKLKEDTKRSEHSSIPSEKIIDSRLAALKAPIQPVPSAGEMEDRMVAFLQGRPPPSQPPPPVHQPLDVRTQTEPANDLITHLLEEIAIDTQQPGDVICVVSCFLILCYNSVLSFCVSDTMEDLQHLDSEYETEEEAMTRILKKASGYNMPPEHSVLSCSSSRTPAAALASQASDSDEDELPWCCICNQDTSIRCHTCDGDLYCNRCFRYLFSSYTAPKKNKRTTT